MLPETDQQVRRQTDAFPADVEPEEVVGEHEEQHRSEEEIEVGEELTTLGVVRHVADRVDVDQRTYTGDEQDETHRQLIKLQSELDLKTVDRDPTEQVLGDGAVGGVAAEHGDEKHHCDDKRRECHDAGEQVAPRVRATTRQQQDSGAAQGQGGEQPDGGRDSS